MALDDSEGLDNPVAKWTVIATMTALVLVLAISTWLAFSVSLDTFTRVEEKTGQIHIRGTETKFVGHATGTYSGHEVLIEGLPSADQIKELPLAWRALCVTRDDPRTDWSQASPMLRVHLHTEEMDEACRPFEGLEVEGSPPVPETTPVYDDAELEASRIQKEAADEHARDVEAETSAQAQGSEATTETE